MNRDRIAGNCKQAYGRVMEQWGTLIANTDMVTAGKYDQLAGINQKKLGVAREMAERQRQAWETRYQQLFEARPKL